MRRLTLTALTAAAALCVSAAAQADDRIATAWQEQAGTAPLLHAPAPPEPATICIIDTGVTVTPDLDVTARRSLLDGTLDDVQATPGQTGHGTAVAHFAAGKVNGWGGAGAFPHARVASVRIFPAGGKARWQDYTKALDHCQKLDPGTKVVVMALGGQDIAPGESLELENRITTMRRRAGFNVVVAAGNGGGATDFPGRYPAAFTVAAVDGDGGLCGFSARGEGVDIAAPGCGAEQAGWDGSMWLMNGTSFAAPIVAGALAALRSYRPDLTPESAEELLLKSARPGPFPTLDASAALRAVGRADVVDTYRSGPAPATGDQPVPAPAVNQSPSVSGVLAAISADAARWRDKRVRLESPRLRVGPILRGRVLVRATNRPREAMLELRVGRRRTVRHSSTVTVPVRGIRSSKARYVTEMTASKWVRLTIRAR